MLPRMQEPNSPPAEQAKRIAVTGLTIRGYRSLRRVEWPKDGLGWGGVVPEIVLVGGVNGSGKTTLLEVIFGVVGFLRGAPGDNSVIDAASRMLPSEAELIDVSVAMPTGARSLKIFTEQYPGLAPDQWGIRLPLTKSSPTEHGSFLPSEHTLAAGRVEETRNAGFGTPGVIYFPTDRSVVFPKTEFKHAGFSERHSPSPVYRYRPPDRWETSIEAILYDARWRDLNAKERGHPEKATHFQSFQDAMHAFLGDTKRFVWDDDGVLHVETDDGAHHPLDALSSGEKQVLLFVAELFQRWTPGSLVLIDEPELHLHESWLAGVWRAICRLQRERGGQVILTTQSNYLFGLGEPGSRVLLGGPL